MEARTKEKIEKNMEELRNSQKQKKKIDLGTVEKTRTLLNEAMASKEQLNEEQKNWLVGMGNELAEFENLDANPHNIPDAVTDIMKTGHGRK